VPDAAAQDDKVTLDRATYELLMRVAQKLDAGLETELIIKGHARFFGCAPSRIIHVFNAKWNQARPRHRDSSR